MRVLKNYGKGDDIYCSVHLYETKELGIKARKDMVEEDIKQNFYDRREETYDMLKVQDIIMQCKLAEDNRMEEPDDYYYYYDEENCTYYYGSYQEDYESNILLVDLPVNF